MLKYFKLRRERKRITVIRGVLERSTKSSIPLPDLLFGFDWVLKQRVVDKLNPTYSAIEMRMFYKATTLLDNVHKFPGLVQENKDVGSNFLPGLLERNDLWNWFTDQGKLLDHESYLTYLVAALNVWVPIDEDAKLCRANDYSYYQRKSIPIREDLTELLKALLRAEVFDGAR